MLLLDLGIKLLFVHIEANLFIERILSGAGRVIFDSDVLVLSYSDFLDHSAVNLNLSI